MNNRRKFAVLGRIVGAGGMCLVPFALSVNLAMAQKAIEPLSATCNTTVTSGSGEGYMGICISAHGNVLKFEGPKGQDHMYADGYALYTGNVCESYYDLGPTEAGETGWAAPNPPVRPGGTLPLTITRSTTDGKFRLVQKFTRNTTERELTIQMTLTNTSGVSQRVSQLVRFIDFDANNTGNNDVIDISRRSVSVHENDAFHSIPYQFVGAMATAISPAFVTSMKHPMPPPGDCLGNGTYVSTPYVSSGVDDVYSLLYFDLGFTMAKATSKVLTMKYQLY